MKKIFMFAAVAAVMCMTACGGSKDEKAEEAAKTAQDYAKEIVELQKQSGEAMTAGDNDKVAEIEKQGKALGQEIDEKCKNDEQFKKDFQEAFAKEMQAQF